MKHLTIFLGLMLGACSPSYAQGVPLTIDAQVGGVEYTSEGPVEIEAETKGFDLPKGFKMVRVAHADKIVCSAYPQPDTWTMKRIFTAPTKPAGLSAAGSNLLDRMGDTQ